MEQEGSRFWSVFDAGASTISLKRDGAGYDVEDIFGTAALFPLLSPVESVKPFTQAVHLATPHTSRPEIRISLQHSRGDSF